MKIDRLIGILSVLLQEEKTTAPERIREKLYQITSEIAKRYEGERE